MGDLIKSFARVYVPDVPGQPYLPASDNCYPPAPAPPVPPPGGGGNGSNPPHGDCYEQPIYQTIISCGGYPPGDPLATLPCVTRTLIVGFVRVCP